MSNGDDLRERVAAPAAPAVKVKGPKKAAPEEGTGLRAEVNRLRRKVAELDGRLDALERAFGGGFNVE